MLNYIIIFLISMVPLVELRGALIYSQAIGMPLLASYIICVIGNMLPVPIIYLFARKVLIWGKDKKHIGKFFTFCIEKGEKGGKKLQETAGKGLFVALFSTFVPNGTVGIVAVAWRVMAEYLPFFIGMYAVLTLYGRQFVAQETSREQ